MAIRGTSAAIVATFILTGTLGAQGRGDLEAHVDSVFSRYTGRAPGCAVGIYQNGAVTFAKPARRNSSVVGSMM